MIAEAIMIATLLHRPPGLVDAIYQYAGLDGVTVVEFESQFNPEAHKREALGGTSWGLWQLWSECHDQHRDELLWHIVAGAEFWAKCKAKAHGDIARAYSIYNSGSAWKSIEKGRQVERKRDSLYNYLWTRLR